MTHCPTLWIPEGAIGDITARAPARWTEKRKHLEKLLFILSIVADKQTGRTHSEAGRIGGWGSYNVTKLGMLIGGPKKATEARNLLEELDLLEVRKNAFGGLSYCASRNAAQVRIPDRLMGGEWVTVPVTDKILLRNLVADEQAKREAVFEAAGREGDRYWTSVRWVDWSLRGLSFAPGVPAEPSPVDSGNPDEDAPSAGRRRAWMGAIADVRDKAFWIRRDTKTGRVFHTASQMPRELRQFLLIDGEETVELDIANAQPAFLLGEFGAEQCTRERDTFASVVSDGRFYEALLAGIGRATPHLHRRYHELFERDRGAFKESVFRQLLFSESKPVPNKMEKAAAHLWPDLTRRLRTVRAEHAGASQLARRLQRAEANLILGNVLPMLQGMPPGTTLKNAGTPLLGSSAKVVTVHDSIICQRRHASIVKRVLEEQTQTILGTALTIREKP